MLDVRDIASESDTLAPAAASKNKRLGKSFIRPILDATGTFAILCLISLSIGAAPSSASPNVSSTVTYQATQSSIATKALGDAETRPVVEIATTSSPANADAVYHRTSVQAAWALLLLGLSIAAALNMALLRHLRQAYATPKRREAPNGGDLRRQSR
jgi:cell division septation protein DedD